MVDYEKIKICSKPKKLKKRTKYFVGHKRDKEKLFSCQTNDLFLFHLEFQVKINSTKF